MVHHPARSSRGMSLVGVLVAVAILGIIAVTLATLYESMTNMMQKSIVTAESENLRKLVQGVMDQKDLCGAALGGVAWAPVGNPPGIDIPQITAGGTRIAWSTAPAQRIGGTNAPIEVARIRLVPPIDPNTGTPMAAFPTSNYSIPGPPAVQHRAYSASLQIEFQRPAGVTQPLLGGVLRPRYVNVVVGVNNTTNVIDDCPGASVQMKDFNCLAQMQAAGTDCEAAATAASASTGKTCKSVYTVSGFDTNGVAQCTCTVTCDPTSAGARGAAGAAGPAGRAGRAGPGPGGRVGPGAGGGGAGGAAGGGGN